MKIISVGKLRPEPTSHSKSILKRVFVKKGLVKKITQVAEVVFKSGDISTEHIHKDMYELFYVVLGEGIVKIKGVVNKLKTGDMVVIEPGETHEFLNTSEKDLKMFYFGVSV